MSLQLKELVYRYSVARSMHEYGAGMRTQTLSEIRASITDPLILQDEKVQEELKSVIRIALDRCEVFKLSGISKGKHNKNAAAQELAARRKNLGRRVLRWYKRLICEITQSSSNEVADGYESDESSPPPSGVNPPLPVPQDVTQHPSDGDSEVGQEVGTRTNKRSRAQPTLVEAGERAKRPRKSTPVTTPTPEVVQPKVKCTKPRRDNFDATISLSDFKSVTTAQKHENEKAELQELADRMAELLSKIGPPSKEWFVDGMVKDITAVRFYAMKPTYIHNVRFRAYKRVVKNVVPPADPIVGTEGSEELQLMQELIVT